MSTAPIPPPRSIASVANLLRTYHDHETSTAAWTISPALSLAPTSRAYLYLCQLLPERSYASHRTARDAPGSERCTWPDPSAGTRSFDLVAKPSRYTARRYFLPANSWTLPNSTASPKPFQLGHVFLVPAPVPVPSAPRCAHWALDRSRIKLLEPYTGTRSAASSNPPHEQRSPLSELFNSTDLKVAH